MGLLDRMRRAWEERGWGEHSPEEEAEADKRERENVERGWPSELDDAESGDDSAEEGPLDEAGQGEGLESSEAEEPPEAD